MDNQWLENSKLERDIACSTQTLHMINKASAIGSKDLVKFGGEHKSATGLLKSRGGKLENLSDPKMPLPLFPHSGAPVEFAINFKTSANTSRAARDVMVTYNALGTNIEEFVSACVKLDDVHANEGGTSEFASVAAIAYQHRVYANMYEPAVDGDGNSKFSPLVLMHYCQNHDLEYKVTTLESDDLMTTMFFPAAAWSVLYDVDLDRYFESHHYLEHLAKLLRDARQLTLKGISGIYSGSPTTPLT